MGAVERLISYTHSGDDFAEAGSVNKIFCFDGKKHRLLQIFG